MPALYLKSESQTATLDAAPPYEATLTRLDGLDYTFAASLESGIPTITPERETWVRDSNGELLFDSNGELLEAAE